MARRFLDDIKQDIATQMADNGQGDFILSQDRLIRIDQIDSLHDDEAAIYNETPAPGPFPTSATWTSLTTGVFTDQVGDDSAGQGFLICDNVNGTITGKNIAGFSYDLRAIISFIGTNNVEYDFAIGVDGVPAFFIGRITGQPGNDSVPINVERLVLSAPANAVFTIMYRTLSGVDTMDDVSGGLIAVIKPTNNPG